MRTQKPVSFTQRMCTKIKAHPDLQQPTRRLLLKRIWVMVEVRRKRYLRCLKNSKESKLKRFSKWMSGNQRLMKRKRSTTTMMKALVIHHQVILPLFLIRRTSNRVDLMSLTILKMYLLVEVDLRN